MIFSIEMSCIKSDTKMLNVKNNKMLKVKNTKMLKVNNTNMLKVPPNQASRDSNRVTY